MTFEPTEELDIDSSCTEALRQFTLEAIDAQDDEVAEQLRTAYESGHTRWWIEVRDDFEHAVVEIAGHQVLAVDIRRLLPVGWDSDYCVE